MLNGGNDAVDSYIAKIVINGRLGANETTPYGIGSKHVISVVANGATVPLQAGPGNDAKFFPPAADPAGTTRIFEIFSGSM